MPASLARTFFIAGVTALDLLLLELSGKSSIGAAHSKEACFPHSSLEPLLAYLFFLFSLAGIVASVARAATASRFILSMQMIASFLSDGMK